MATLFCDYIQGHFHCMYPAKKTILLGDGTEFYSCNTHVIEVIRDNAETHNPVHSVEDIDDQPDSLRGGDIHL